MNVEELLRAAVNGPLTEETVQRACAYTRTDAHQLIDDAIKLVVREYQSNRLSWSDADMAMNYFFSYAIARTDTGLSQYGWAVYEAFDQGEFGENGEKLTQQLLAKVAHRA